MIHQTEAQLQKVVAAWLSMWGVLFTHPANGAYLGKGKARRGAQLRRDGVSAGVPDLLIFEPTAVPFDDEAGLKCEHRSHGLAIELKVNTRAGKKQYPTPNQRQWMADLKARGWRCAVCRSLDEVKVACECLRPLHGRGMPF